MHDILIGKKILERNEEVANENRGQFEELGIFVINMVSAPGAGKTTILEKTIERLKDKFQIAVIEGDIQTDNDARRIEKCRVPVKQITTGRTCHLDAHMISHTLDWLKGIKGLKLLFIENVGNLVCPAEYDLGEDCMVSVISVAEGDDKPLKYPAIFHASDALIINKIDLLPYINFNMKLAKDNAIGINHNLKICEMSCTTGKGLDEWCDWVKKDVSR
ncbi:MAG: hydrogenase accessory protein HypB [Deltaproteobacteria bacterium GWC2_42_11]|nr:MAG: hydrogenase accessory protein HypB [Deltaproteobacteria bacterium GWC2_42_11]HBO83963.1 hydrogenase accessory protein HypB [Deltaproteobacteria bacterium]